MMSRIADMHAVVGQPHEKTNWHNFAPRIAMAWDLTGQGKMSVRAGIGEFYDRAGGQLTTIVACTCRCLALLRPANRRLPRCRFTA